MFISKGSDNSARRASTNMDGKSAKTKSCRNADS